MIRLKFLVAFFTIVAVKNCNEYTIEKSLPLSVEEAFFIMTPPGRRGGKTQLQIKIKYTASDQSKDVSVQGIYFKGCYIKLNNAASGVLSGVTYFSLDPIKGHTMEKDVTSKEGSKNFEFNCGKCELELKPNEAILYFLENGKEKFYKIELQQQELSDVPM